MRECIICNLEKMENEFNKEHIIPSALGNNKLYFYKVCKSCNEKLGRNVDWHLTEDMLVKLIRNDLKLKSQSGVIPNPFSKGIDSKGRIIRTDNNFTPSVGSLINEDNDNITIECSTIEEAKSIAIKKLKRKGFKEEAINSMLESATRRTQSFQPDMKMDFTIDMPKIKLAFVKIAYEYGIFKLGDTFCLDMQAEEIRKCLKNASDGNLGEYKLIMQMPEIEYDNIIKKAPKDKNIHILSFDIDENQLVVNIILFKKKALSFSVCISLMANHYNLHEFDPDIVDLENSQD